MTTTFTRRTFAALLGSSALAGPALGAARNAEQQNGSWAELQDLMYEEGTFIGDGRGFISLDTPYRAHDAAVVPIEIEITPPGELKVDHFTVLVEENPAPVAGTFHPGAPMGRNIRLSTRIRVDAYTNVRVIAKLSDGSMWQTANYVKAAGGCSAPSLKDAEAALKNVGKMKVRLFDRGGDKVAAIRASAAGEDRREAQVMVRHPNYSGFQMNQVTQLFIPAYFIDELEVSQGDATIFRMEGGISISEDPAIRFDFTPNGDAPMTVRAHDTDGDEYERAFPVTIAS